MTVRVCVPASQDLEHFDHSPTVHWGHGTSPHFWLILGFSGSRHLPTWLFLHVTVRVCVPPSQDLEHFDHVPVIHCGHGSVLHCMVSSGLSVDKQVPTWLFWHVTVRVLIPPSQDFEHFDHSPADHIGHGMSLQFWVPAGLSVTKQSPTWLFSQDTVRFWIPPPQVLLHFDHWLADHFGHGSLPHDLVLSGFSLSIHAPTFSFLQITVRVWVPPSHNFEHFDHWPADHLGHGTSAHVLLVTGLSLGKHSPTWLFSHITVRVWIPPSQDLEHSDHSPSDHNGHGTSLHFLAPSGLSAKTQSPTWLLRHVIVRVWIPPLQDLEHDDHSVIDHSGHGNSPHILVLSGLSFGKHSPTWLLLHVTVRVCIPPSHDLEHSDHKPTDHSGHDTSPHCMVSSGLSISEQAPTWLLLHFTVLVWMPPSQDLEHGDHSVIAHSGHGTSAQLWDSCGFSLGKHAITWLFSQDTVRFLIPPSHDFEHFDHWPTDQCGHGSTLHVWLTIGLSVGTQSPIWLLLHVTIRFWIPPSHILLHFDHSATDQTGHGTLAHFWLVFGLSSAKHAPTWLFTHVTFRVWIPWSQDLEHGDHSLTDHWGHATSAHFWRVVGLSATTQSPIWLFMHLAIRVWIPPLQVLEHFDHSATDHLGHGTSSHFWLVAGLSLATHSPTCLFLQITVRVWIPPLQVLEHFDHWPTDHMGQGFLWQCFMVRGFLAARQSPMWLFTHLTLLYLTPPLQDFEHLDHAPTIHHGHGPSLHFWLDTGLIFSRQSPTWIFLHVTILVWIPPLQDLEHTDHSPTDHSGHGTTPHRLLLSGLFVARQSPTWLLLHLTVLVCVPLLQDLEHFDHSVTDHFGHGNSPQWLVLFGLLVAKHSPTWLLLQDTVLDWIPPSQLFEHFDHSPTYHSGQDTLRQLLVSRGFSVSKHSPTWLFLQLTILYFTPPSHDLEHFDQLPTVHFGHGISPHVWLVVSLSLTGQSPTWLLLHETVLVWKPPSHDFEHSLHIPMTQLGHGSSPHCWFVDGLSFSEQLPTSLFKHTIFRVWVPPPHDLEHFDHSPRDHSGHGTSPHFLFVLGLSSPVHLPIWPFSQVTALVCIPPPQVLEHFDQLPTDQYGHCISPHFCLSTGLFLASHRPMWLFLHEIFRDWIPPPQLLEQPDHSPINHNGHATLRHVLIPRGLSAAKHSPTWVFLQNTTLIFRPPPQDFEHFLHGPTLQCGHGSLPQLWFVGGLSLLRHSPTWLLLQVTERDCIPPLHDLEHDDHSPTVHCGHGTSLHATIEVGFVSELHFPTRLFSHVTDLFFFPPPQNFEHFDHWPTDHSGHGTLPHFLVLSGLSVTKQSPTRLLLHVTVRVCVPPLQDFEHFDHWPTDHFGHGTWPHSWLVAGLFLSKHSPIWLFWQVTFLVCIPPSQDSEHFDHWPTDHMGHGTWPHFWLPAGLLCSKHEPTWLLLQDTILACLPPLHDLEHSDHGSAIHCGQGSSPHFCLVLGLLCSGHSPAWLLVQLTFLLCVPPLHDLEQTPQGPTVHCGQDSFLHLLKEFGLTKCSQLESVLPLQ